MAIKRRGKAWYTYFEPFRDRHQVGLRLDVTSKQEAKQVEAMIVHACRSGNYSGLPPAAQAACVRMFQNQRWELPPELGGVTTAPVPQEQLTLWKACELFLKYPEIRNSPSRWRHEISLSNIAEKLGRNTPLKSIWVPALKTYQIERLNDDTAPDTVNRELSSLSRLFGVMMELQLVESNPARLVRRLSVRSGERQVYLSAQTVKDIAGQGPDWYPPILWTAYYTGMRRGELLGLTRKQMDLSRRIVTLSPLNTKEVHWKRVPIHRDLLPILEQTLRGPSLISGKVFALTADGEVRDLELEAFKNVWPRACQALKFEQPWPRFHDLRHTWRTNARRSGMDPTIAETILGHWTRARSVTERYGRIDDNELVRAIDRMTFEHGSTEILVAK